MTPWQWLSLAILLLMFAPGLVGLVANALDAADVDSPLQMVHMLMLYTVPIGAVLLLVLGMARIVVWWMGR